MNKEQQKKRQQRIAAQKRHAVTQYLMGSSNNAKSIIVYFSEMTAVHLVSSELPQSNASTQQLADLINGFIVHYPRLRQNKDIVIKVAMMAVELASRTANAQTMEARNLHAEALQLLEERERSALADRAAALETQQALMQLLAR